MNEWFSLHWYLVAGIGLLVVGALCVLRAMSADSRQGRASWLSNLLIWPAVIREDEGWTRRAFIVVGIVVILLLVFFGIWINPSCPMKSLWPNSPLRCDKDAAEF